MMENYGKYRLVLGGDLSKYFTGDSIKTLIKMWGENSGARNVSSGCIRCDGNDQALIYSAHFDSAHWTGIGFEGFDKKDPGEPQTL